MNHQIYVISHKRPKAVVEMTRFIGSAIWCVGIGEKQDYINHGAERVEETGGLCQSRNWALVNAYTRDIACVQVSDDLKGLKLVIEPGKKETRPIKITEAIELMIERMRTHGGRYAGCAPTANAFFTNRRLSEKHFIVGDFITVMPGELRFDENLRLKEDYDFTVQHLKTYGKVARCDDILATFLHRTNSGGAVDYRTSAREQEAIAYLKTKHPGWFVANPRRKDEILLKMPKTV